jgi:hypothetical protein
MRNEEVGEDGLGNRELLVRTAVVTLDWTPLPGAFELELRRRHANPLFPSARQVVTKADLKRAKVQDAADAWDALDDFISLELGRKKLARLETVEEVDAALIRIEGVGRRLMEVGGQAERLADPLRQLRAELIEHWRTQHADDPAFIKTLTAADRSRSYAVSNAFVAQLLRDDGPIGKKEWPAAILSESPQTITTVMAALSAARRSEVQRKGSALLRRLDERGIDVDDSDDKLAALLN